MNILLIKHFFVGFMVSEIPRVSDVFGHCPYSVTFPYQPVLGNEIINTKTNKYKKYKYFAILCCSFVFCLIKKSIQ